MAADYRELVEFIAGGIAEAKDHVQVRLEHGGRTTLVVIEAAEEDMGRLIGKGGRNIEAIRSVVRAAGLRHHERVQVDVTTRA